MLFGGGGGGRHCCCLDVVVVILFCNLFVVALVKVSWLVVSSSLFMVQELQTASAPQDLEPWKLHRVRTGRFLIVSSLDVVAGDLIRFKIQTESIGTGFFNTSTTTTIAAP